MNYWLSPEGRIILVKDHYTAICRDPDRFDLSRDHIKEAKGVKGSEDLMRLLLNRNWIRVTYNERFYTLEFNSWSLLHRGHIRSWMMREQIVGKVHLVSLDGKYNRTVTERGQI
jgi:hypothetical protein